MSDTTTAPDTLNTLYPDALAAQGQPSKPLSIIRNLQASQWLLDSDEDDRTMWLDALAMALHSLHWQGDVSRLSDALPRESLGEGVDDLLNALAALGFVASPIGLEQESMWRSADLPLIAIMEKEDESATYTYPVVVTGWGSFADSWQTVSLNGAGELRHTQELIERERVVQLFSIQRTDQMHDSSVEFARSQTGVSWMQALLGRFHGLFGQLMAVSFIVGALTIAVPLFVMAVYDLVIDAHSVSSMSNATTLLLQLLLGVALAMATESALRLAMIRSMAWFGARMQVLVGTAIISQFLALSPVLTERASVADQLSRIRAFDAVRDFISGPQMLSMLELPWCLVLLLVIGLLGGEMVLVPLLSIAAFVALAYAIRKPLEYEMYSSARSGSERQQTAMDMLTRLPAMKYAGVGEAMFERYSGAVRKSMRTTFRINLMIAILEHSAHALTAIAGLLTLVVGMFYIWDGAISVGALVAIMILTWRLLGIVQANCVLQPRVHYLRTSAAQINRLMGLKPEDADYQREINADGLQGRIECNGVILRYSRSGEYVLRGLNLQAEPGQLIAVMGQSGAGKSSMLKVLCDLYAPQAGTVRIDGINIRQYVPHSLRQHIGYLPQQVEFFSGTIAENLRLTAPDASDAQLREAVDYAGAAEEIASMEDGLATEIGIGKAHLPPSLAHRLNLARIYLQDKRILLLDELPYDVLNSVTGERLYDVLREARGKRTIVYVTHRMDFAELADQVVWLRHDMQPMVGTPKQILTAMQKEQQP